jgi:ATP-dependent DNA helicase RecG
VGSGVRNIYKYNKIYSGAEPTFIEGDVFKTIIPLTSQVTPQGNPQATPQADEEVKGLLEFCGVPRTRSEMQEFMKLNDRENFRKNILNPLIKGGLLKLTIPAKPTSPKQKYYSKRR